MAVLTAISTVPTSVTVATCAPLRTTSPTQNCRAAPPRYALRPAPVVVMSTAARIRGEG
jgi:hypothetical protein